MNGADSGGFIFVYGGLMRGFDLHRHIASGTFIGAATVSGALYSTGQYPALVEGAGIVHGELYQFADIAVALEELDEVEEYDPLDAHASLYRRELRPVHTDAGRDVLAWVYLYNRDVKRYPRVQSDDWRAR